MSRDDVVVRRFAEIDPVTAYRLWALREAVFVVEQRCPYQELDGRDLEAATRHLWVEAGGEPVACLRLLHEGADRGWRIGRVATAPSHRGRGLASRLVERAVAVAGDERVRLDAQAHLERWYEGLGFARAGAGFVEDGIPHVPMERSPV